MARQLVQAMSSEFKPSEYRDEFREKLTKAIAERMKHKGARVEKPAEEEPESGKVVDLMAVLKKSLEQNAQQGGRRGPARAPKPRHARAAHRKRA